jgi:hypothetical protein
MRNPGRQDRSEWPIWALAVPGPRSALWYAPPLGNKKVSVGVADYAVSHRFRHGADFFFFWTIFFFVMESEKMSYAKSGGPKKVGPDQNVLFWPMGSNFSCLPFLIHFLRFLDFLPIFTRQLSLKSEICKSVLCEIRVVQGRLSDNFPITNA